MRVYGATPLYNYVELIFRSKRLFIVSIILATLLTASLAILRTNTYTATATILLTGSAETGPQQLTEQQRGSVQYKLDVLNLVLKDPNFIKEFLTDYGLDRGMSPDQFEAYSRDVKKSLSYSAGDNILEISCKWHNPQCTDIVESFYKEYRRHVIDMETVNSHSQTGLLQNLLSQYDQRLRENQQKIAQWQKNNTNDPMMTPEEADREAQQQKQTVQNYQTQLDQATQNLSMLEGMLAKTPSTNTEVTVREGTPQVESTEYLALQNSVEELQHRLTALQAKYTDAHPAVVGAMHDLKAAQDRLAEMKKHSSTAHKPGTGDVRQTRDVVNPRHQELEYQVDQQRITVNTLKDQLAYAQKMLDTLNVNAKKAPDKVVDYEELTKDSTILAQNRAELASKLETAKMEEQRDVDLHSNEISMMIKPQAEPELVGAKSLIFYAAGPLLGIIIAFGISLLSETMDPTLRTPLEVEKHINKPVLAVLPTIRPDRRASRRILGAKQMAQDMPPGAGHQS